MPAARAALPEGDDFVQNEHAQQQMIMREQDQQLDHVMHTVVNMKHMASTINNELDGQAEWVVHVIVLHLINAAI